MEQNERFDRICAETRDGLRFSTVYDGACMPCCGISAFDADDAAAYAAAYRVCASKHIERRKPHIARDRQVIYAFGV
jgi:hypothetical protein